ncbi:PREDICTED: serine racemase-like isoform X2 [Priapulus caudatus]|uniref:Serine racemase-like isoform X2 n=1 Tax=Priapulus caudatus TaxID=37621 RepID=A0ABM1DVL0_PRICU|nr:PREDICTED: serine racemase-like isoform X2 [Priapulus caudatus]
MTTTFEDVVAARGRISKYAQTTPVFTSSTVDAMTGQQVFFKAENLQTTGSFKVRGALYAISKLMENNPDVPGVVTHSSGNNAQAVAWVARRYGLPCTVACPSNASEAKIRAMKSYGAEVVFCEPNMKSREECAAAICAKTGRALIHSFDNVDVIAGQGTMAMEFLEQVPDLDAMLVCIGGGGMAAGVALTVKAMRPSCKGQRDANDSSYVATVADGIRCKQVGKHNMPILCENAEKNVLTVNDTEIIDAMKFIWTRMKLVIETSAAAPVAALLSGKLAQVAPHLEKVGIILCGGNVDLNNLPWE